MSGKSREEPAEGAHGKQPSAKRPTPESAAESLSTLAPVTITFSMRCDTRALSDRKEALEAVLRRVVAEFGGKEFRMGRTRVGPTDDTLWRVLPFVVEHVGPAFLLQCSQASKAWRQELQARGFCPKTLQLCSTLVRGGKFEHLQEIVLQRLNASSGPAERAVWLEANAFLQSSWKENGDFHERLQAAWVSTSGWGLHKWLQAASQEPAASFLSRAASSTAQILGLPLVRWVNKPEWRYPGVLTLRKYLGWTMQGETRRSSSADLTAVAFSPDGTRIVIAAWDGSVQICDTATGALVSSLGGQLRGRALRGVR